MICRKYKQRKIKKEKKKKKKTIIIEFIELLLSIVKQVADLMPTRNGRRAKNHLSQYITREGRKDLQSSTE